LSSLMDHRQNPKDPPEVLTLHRPFRSLGSVELLSQHWRPRL
jgi:hypothetical protein